MSEDPQGSRDDIRLEAAHIISSISYGNEDALASLLRADALRAFLYALANLSPSESTALKAAYVRALRTLASAIAEVVGPSHWGLRPDTSAIRNEAKAALDFLFLVKSMDIYLPFLLDPLPQINASVALMIGSTVRNREQRQVVVEWLPPADRLKEVKSKRGWEKLATTHITPTTRQGGWVAKTLTDLLGSRDLKVQEAALNGLAALAQENGIVAAALRTRSDSMSFYLYPFDTLLRFFIQDLPLYRLR